MIILDDEEARFFGDLLEAAIESVETNDPCEVQPPATLEDYKEYLRRFRLCAQYGSGKEF